MVRYPSNTSMHEIRNAFRAMKAAPVVSAVAVLSLALGIGANTAIFSILDSLLLRSLPVEDPQRLVMVGQLPNGRTSLDQPDLGADPRSRPSSSTGAFAWSSTRFNLAQGGPTEFVDGVWASGGYFDVLGVPAILGRTFTTDDDRRGGGPDGAGGGHQLRLLAAALRRRGRRHRPLARRRARAVHDRRRHAAGVLRRRRRPHVRRRHPARHRAAHPRQGELARSPLDLVAERHGPPASRIRRSSRRRPRCAASSRRCARPRMPQDWREDDKQSYLEGAVRARPGGDRQLRPAHALPAAAHDAHGRRRPRAAHRLREHRQPAARARDGAAPRAERAPGARRLARAAGAAAAEREPACSRAAAPLLGLLFAHWGSRLLVRQLSTSTNNVHLELALDWRVLGFTAGVAIATAVLFGTVPGAARHARAIRTTRSRRRAAASPASTASRSATCSSSSRSRSRWCCSSARACSCARSRRSPTSTSASTGSQCWSRPSTSSRCSSNRTCARTCCRGSARPRRPRLAWRARRSPSSRRSAAARGATGSSCSTASPSRSPKGRRS